MSIATAVPHEPPLRSIDEEVVPNVRAPLLSRDTRPRPQSPSFHKSASYTYIADAKDSAYNSAASLPITIKGSVSEDDFDTTLDSADVSPPDSSGYTTPSEDPKVSTDVVRDLNEHLGKSPHVTIIPPSDVKEQGSVALPEGKGDEKLDDNNSKGSLKPSGGLAKRSRSLKQRLSRKNSPASSRSPSPAKRTPAASESTSDNTSIRPNFTEGRRKSLLRRRESSVPSEDKAANKPPSRKGSILKRRTSTKSTTGYKDTTIPAVPSLPKSFSTDRLPTVSENHKEEFPVPSLPRLVSGDKVASFGTSALARKKDELWTIFRNLDGDYTKFSSKSTSLKANVVRQSLLPFLRNYADHASNNCLRSEDLDRRANILNKWWLGLLEILNGKNNQSLSGTDRPAILDALSGLMDRPEWRMPPSVFAPLAARNAAAQEGPGPRNRSVTSLTSTGGDFLSESVHHNVRNLFVQNLSSQMSFVVDKMSLRNASASLVTFCGKATAYAFFFCPGIADVLVRLWSIPSETARRVLTENGVGRFDNLLEASANIASVFPPAVQTLSFVSLSRMMRTLREQPVLPLGTANMQWYGYWLERWLGRESDLFYVFVKHYHILATEYLPSEASKQERMCAPGMLLVHCQILTNLDWTIHRDDIDHSEGPVQTPGSFDDLMGEPDALVTPVPILPPNTTRIMAENRLIMLLRDFLSERTSDHPTARHLFAISFNDILHAAARRTSVFSHSSCYTLCDFLEEALLILVRYEHMETSQGDVVDSGFWIDVCRKMMTSHNTMTEIRLFAFLYSIWGIMCSSQDRKTDLCLNLLLDDEVFDQSFNHWCPMIRAYYMRLLCWRLGRFDGEATDLDAQIYERLFELLRREWAYFLYAREDAERRRVLPPSTAPSNPAPGRRLLIIRTDTQAAPSGSFLAFNGIVPPSPAVLSDSSMMNNKSTTTISPLPDLAMSPISQCTSFESDIDTEKESTLRSFLRGIMGGSSKKRPDSRGTSRPTSGTTSPTKTAPGSLARAATDDGNTTPRARASAARPAVPAPVPQYRNYCFKFSLEYSHKLASNVPGNMRIYAPRLPLAAQQYLQSRAAGIPAVRALEPTGAAKARAQYVGRALAEWTIVVGECQGFFDRRKAEGVPADKCVETPTLGVEVYRRSA